MVPMTTDRHCELKQITHMIFLSDIVSTKKTFDQLSSKCGSKDALKKTWFLWIFCRPFVDANGNYSNWKSLKLNELYFHADYVTKLNPSLLITIKFQKKKNLKIHNWPRSGLEQFRMLYIMGIRFLWHSPRTPMFRKWRSYIVGSYRFTFIVKNTQKYAISLGENLIMLILFHKCSFFFFAFLIC